MLETIIIVLSVLIVFFGLITFLLFYIGLVNPYHPYKKAKQNQIKVACVGDSITYGCFVKNRNKNNYPTVLNNLLGNNYCVNNFGYTNRTVITDADYPYVTKKTYKQSLNFNPDIVIILLGSNDSKKVNWNKEKFINDYCELIDSYLNLPSKPKVYLVSTTPMFEFGKKDLYNLRMDIINNDIFETTKQVAKIKDIPFIDVSETFKDKQNLFVDGIHPNKHGSKLLAQTIFEKIKWNK